LEQSFRKTGNPLPEQTLNLCLNTDAVLFGSVDDTNLNPIQGLLKLRQALGLFANIRPIKPYTDLLDLSPLKEKLLMVLILLFSERNFRRFVFQ
jgi:3-isopropylmalate dehydrogenase